MPMELWNLRLRFDARHVMFFARLPELSPRRARLFARRFEL